MVEKYQVVQLLNPKCTQEFFGKEEILLQAVSNFFHLIYFNFQECLKLSQRNSEYF
jgi:hypothetical protein